MKITQHSIIVSVLLTAAASFGNSFAAAEEFQGIADVPQTAKSLNVSPVCPTGDSSAPNTMFTVETSDTLTVSTSPPNLVTVSVTGEGALSFAWNTEVSSTASSGGVKIGFPAGELESVKAEKASTVQIMNGFSALTYLEVSGASGVTADLSSNATPLGLSVSGSSILTLKSGSNVSSGSISGSSALYVATPSFESISLTGASKAEVDGTMVSVSVSGASDLTASGSISGDVSLSGASTINADISGNIVNTGSSTVNAAVAVDVSITEQSMTLSGTGTCARGIIGSIADLFSGSSSVYSHSCRAVGVGVLAGVLPWVFG